MPFPFDLENEEEERIASELARKLTSVIDEMKPEIMRVSPDAGAVYAIAISAAAGIVEAVISQASKENEYAFEDGIESFCYVVEFLHKRRGAN